MSVLRTTGLGSSATIDLNTGMYKVAVSESFQISDPDLIDSRICLAYQIKLYDRESSTSGIRNFPL
jgi:hypothetical protein